MAPPAWAGESSSSIAFSTNPRDSRVVSIYDKYLYDPKDLESSDPRRRELARKASQLKLHGRPVNALDANGLRSVDSANSRSPQRKSIAFSHNTKLADGRTAASATAPSNGTRQHPQPSYHASASSERFDESHDRDSGAFGLGLGMLGGSDSESDSDSDDERRKAPRNKALDQLKHSAELTRSDSWTDRAVAVGHRPPDNASQNPPSLKLMALKSAKNGGDASRTSQDDRRSRLTAQDNLVDRTSRHGSTIGFGGSHIDDHPDPRAQANQPPSKHLSARAALTKQLGLASPNPEANGHAHPNRGPSPAHSSGPHDYFDNRAPNVTQPRPNQRSAGPPPIDVARAQNGLGGRPQDVRGAPSPMGSHHGSVSTPTSATPLRSPGYSAHGMPSPNHPNAGVAPPPNVLQRGPPSPYDQRGGPVGPGGPGGPGGPPQYGPRDGNPRAGPGPGPGPGAGPPHPSSLQAGNHARPPPGQYPRQAGPPGPNQSFSDAPGPSKRQSLFRRSMAMLGGGPQAGPAGYGQQRGGPPQKRQSLFRRSMAMLTGNNAGPAPQQRGPQMPVPAPARAPAAPRVQGLQNDFEKPDHPRKSQFLGAGGEGAEWDTNGEGAKFWRRFSMAQKTAGTHKVEDGSRAWMASMASGRRKLIVMGFIALVTLVGIIVGVIVWREIVSPSGSTSDEPTAVYKANLGAKDNPAGTTTKAATSTSRNAKATATASSSSSYYNRALADGPSDEGSNLHVRRALAHELVTPRRRRRHFGQSAPVQPVNSQRSLAELD
ncbi:hypothetical protein PaG_06556 [Moesziomyces aphidis]|uniref:Uncharacterized protein n=1 Tax=Moesziomyces aphidis TaxID=84754 RepID=W3VFN4_MOEAP|nr:hypothetical protein PaG_06556 [Moesziomyces aphidis]